MDLQAVVALLLRRHHPKILTTPVKSSWIKQKWKLLIPITVYQIKMEFIKKQLFTKMDLKQKKIRSWCRQAFRSRKTVWKGLGWA